MSDLPPGWAACSVRDITESIKPGFASGRHNSASEGVPHLRPMNVSRLGVIDLTEVKSVNADAGAKRLRRGDILFNNTNSPELVGKSATFDLKGDFAFSNHMTCVRPVAGVNAAFLGRQIHYRWMSGELRRFISNHVNQASISSGRLADEVPVVLPPVAEQERIVTAIDEAFSKLDAGEAALRATRQRLRRLRESVLAAAVTGRLVPQDPTDEPASNLLAGMGLAPSESVGLPELPSSWAWSPFSAVISSLRNGIFVSRPSSQPPGTPILRIGSVRPMPLNISDVGFTSADIEDAPVSRALIAEGDLLFTRYNGNPTFVGACAAVPPLRGPSLHPDKLIRVVVDPKKVVSKYVELAMAAGASRRFISSITKTTAGQAGIAGSDLRRAPVPAPPLAEQSRIVIEVERQFSFIDACERTIDVGFARSGALHRSILKSAFEGKLVPQDPTDELAEALLRRIAESKGVGEAAKRLTVRQMRARA